MNTANEITTEFLIAFREQGVAEGELPIKVNGITFSQFPEFADYVSMATFLSAGPRNNASVFQNALIALEADMIARVNKYYSKQSRAIKYFNMQAVASKAKQPAPPKDSDFSKLLTKSLSEFERNHGFLVTGDKLPNYAGFVYGNVFKEALEQRQPWKDVGAGAAHGEFTHRLQWYIMIHAGIIQTTPVNQEATVFASIAAWQKGKTNLWTYLFDRPALLGDLGVNDPLDFRCPENLNAWLVADTSPNFCPVLRSFLRARMEKRDKRYELLQYLAEKTSQGSADQYGLDRDGAVMTKSANPSARINYPLNQGEKGAYAPFHA